MVNKQAKIFVVSGASGTGKTTLCRAVIQALGLYFSVSATTRAPRNGEQEGKDYYFLTRDEFEKKVAQGEFLEWAQVHGQFYGTLKQPIQAQLAAGRSVLLDLDTQGALQLKQAMPEAVLIFIKAPSLAVLKERLEQRATDDVQVIEARMQRAQAEIAKSDAYDFVITNENLETATQALTGLIKQELQ